MVVGDLGLVELADPHVRLQKKLRASDHDIQVCTVNYRPPDVTLGSQRYQDLVAPHRAFPARCTVRFLLRAFPPEACSGTLRFKDITGSAATFRNVRFTVRTSRARHPFHTVAAFRV